MQSPNKVHTPSHVTDHCPISNSMNPDPHYESVCSNGGDMPCNCAEYDWFEPAECCTAEGELDKSEKCNGEM